MASLFSRIIDGTLPGRLVWQDADVVAFLTIAPVTLGHTLVVPRAEVDKWTDLPTATWLRTTEVAQVIGQALVAAFDAPRAGVLVAGFEVPHTHIHVFPASDMSDFDLSRADENVTEEEMDSAAEKIRQRLSSAGHSKYARST